MDPCLPTGRLRKLRMTKVYSLHVSWGLGIVTCLWDFFISHISLPSPLILLFYSYVKCFFLRMCFFSRCSLQFLHEGDILAIITLFFVFPHASTLFQIFFLCCSLFVIYMISSACLCSDTYL